MTKYDWIVLELGEPNLFVCQRCKEKVTCPDKCRLDTWSEMSRGFTKVHKKCKAGDK